MAERLFDDETAEAGFLFQQPGLGEILRDRPEEARGGGEIESDIARALQSLRQLHERLGIVEFRLEIGDFVFALRPGSFRFLVGKIEMFGELLHDALVRPVVDDEDIEIMSDQTITGEIDDRRRQQPTREIAGAEDHEDRWWSGIAGLQPWGTRHYCGISTWPPKPWRMAESSLSPKLCSTRERYRANNAEERT